MTETPVATGCRVRPATAEDSSEIRRLLVAGLGYEPDALDHLQPRLAAAAGSDALQVFVAELDDQIVGVATFVIVHPLEYRAPQARVTAIAVSDDARRAGTGTALMSRLEQAARDLGCFRLELTSSHELTDAHAFWRDRGYTESGLRFVNYIDR